MPFTLNAYLPSLNRELQIKELSYKQYRELVKSLYNTDKKETIQQYNSILKDLCPDIVNFDITFEDKLSLLLIVRNYCVSPDLKLKGTANSGNTFNFSIPVEKIISSIKTIHKSKTLQFEDIVVKISSYKARDEYIFIGNNKDIFNIITSYIDAIEINGNFVNFKDLSFEDRMSIVTSLPHYITSQIYESIKEIEDYYNKQVLLEVKNPIDREIALTISKNINIDGLQKVIEFIFTEDLSNIYRAFYNMVKYAGFSPAYIDSITPVEMQVYWMYYIEDHEKSKSSNTSSGGLNLSTSTSNTQLGFQ